MTPQVAILDYGCGNLASVVNAIRKVGGEPLIHCLGDGPTNATHVVLPGQGAFRQLADAERSELELYFLTVPILGICLGMQLMCEFSEEAPGVRGLGWFPYPVRRLTATRLPHVGWNTADPVDNRDLRHDYYFCHSYVVSHGANGDPWVSEHDAWLTNYEGNIFVSAIYRSNLWATQFHPEKSGTAGLELLRQFLAL